MKTALFIRSLLTFGQVFFCVGQVEVFTSGCKTMIFKEKIEGKALKNHVFQTKQSHSEQFCRVLCYLDDRCISYNYGTSANGDKGMCELSESDHVMHEEDFVDRPDTVYFRAENDCNCPKEKTCQFNFVDNTHRCRCKEGFTGSLCNVAIPTTTSSPTSSTTDASSSSPSSPLSSSTPSSTTDVSSSTTDVSSSSSPSSSSSSPSSTTDASSSSTMTTEASSSSTSSSTSSTTTEASSSSPPSSTSSTTTEASSSSPPSSSSSSAPTTVTTTEAPTTTASSSRDCELQFQTASINNMIRIQNPFSFDLGAFTVSFWLKVPASKITLYPFSYATTDVTGAFSIGIKEDGVTEIQINGGAKSIQSFLQRNDKWQHFAVTWESRNGNVKLYYNGGQQTSHESGLAQEKTFPIGGLLIVGQKQGGYDSGFDATSTIKGNLAGLNIWSSEYTSQAVRNVYNQKCDVPAGDVLSWADILKGEIKGNVPKVCPATCHS